MATILYLHQYFHTPEDGGAIRSYHIAKSIVIAGHKVIVITAHNHPIESTSLIEGIEVHYLPVFYENNLSKTGRILSFLKFMWRCIKKGSSLHRKHKFTFCYATSTPLTIGVPALFFYYRFRIPFIFEVRDLWPEAAIQMGFLKNGFIKWLLKKLEITLYKKAKHIIALSPGMKMGILPYVSETKASMIPNMSDVDFFQFHPTSLHTPIKILYAGSIGKSNDINRIIALANYFSASSLSIEITIAGKGSELAHCKHEVETQQISNIHFRPFSPKKDMNVLFQEHHFFLISFKELPILQTNSPNKFFDAIAAGKPCLINVDGWISELISDHQIGFSCKESEFQNLEKKFTHLLSHPEEYSSMCERARKLAESQFDKNYLCSQITQLIENTKH